MFAPSKFLCFAVAAVKSAKKKTLKSIKLLFLKGTISWVICLNLGSFLVEQTAASGLSLTGFHTSSKAARHDSSSICDEAKPKTHMEKKQKENKSADLKERLRAPEQRGAGGAAACWTSPCRRASRKHFCSSTDATSPKPDCLFKQSQILSG